MKNTTHTNAIIPTAEQEDEVILKWLFGEPLSLEETAIALYMRSNRQNPISRQAVYNIEARTLKKLKDICPKFNITKEEALGMFTDCKTTAKEKTYS